LRVCVCVRAFRACMRAFRACERACMRARACVLNKLKFIIKFSNIK